MSAKEKASGKNYYSRLIIAVTFLAVLFLVIFLVLFNVSKKNVLNIGHLNAVQMAQDLEYYLIEEIDEIALAAHTVEIMQDTGKTNEEIIEYLTFESRIVTETIDENYTGLYGYINGQYMDGSGWIPDDGYDPIERPWYIGAIKGGGDVVYITPYIDSETGSVMMSICKMLRDKQSVVSLDVSLDRIQAIVDSDYFDEYDRIIVTDKENIVVAASDQALLGTNITNDPLIEESKSDKAKLDPNGYFIYRTDLGERFSVYTSEVEGQWNVFLVKKNSKLMSSPYNIYAILFGGTLAFIIFVSYTFDYLNKRRRVAENLNKQLESIADIYVSVHKFDIERDRIEEIRCMPYVREQIRIAERTSNSSYKVLEKVMKALVLNEHWEDMKAFIDLNTLDVRVGNSDTVSHEFLGIHGWSKARIIILERKNDRISSFLWMIENINEEKRKQSELRYLSETDLMTGIRNRGCGEKLIKEQLEKQVGGMFCLMDADHFKSINDSYGHDVGDAVIKAIATCLKGSFAATDIVLRLGGDEFAAFAIGIENEVQAQGILSRFISEIGQVEIPAFRGERKIEMSIGASFITAENMKSFESVYKEADRAVYRSKMIPGSRVTFYNADVDL